jgi:hypothetical protein
MRLVAVIVLQMFIAVLNENLDVVSCLTPRRFRWGFLSFDLHRPTLFSACPFRFEAYPSSKQQLEVSRIDPIV